MQMEELRKQWITSEKEYREGEVFVYRQKFTASQVKKACFTAQPSACMKQN